MIAKHALYYMIGYQFVLRTQLMLTGREPVTADDVIGAIVSFSYLLHLAEHH